MTLGDLGKGVLSQMAKQWNARQAQKAEDSPDVAITLPDIFDVTIHAALFAGTFTVTLTAPIVETPDTEGPP